MTSRDAFLRWDDRVRDTNGPQDSFEGQALSCCFDPVDDDGRGSRKAGLVTG